eukprot:TRINITY_DN11281_c0_g1_i1.p1 TRINITY_DN11281_c0_g1~~TRINITY_DN11281_c0_g1_i1.p1  ORF type:complete len:387 (+),score=97.41 TRINITY_DN11281_c0_g1_i1:40-1200(+)
MMKVASLKAVLGSEMKRLGASPENFEGLLNALQMAFGAKLPRQFVLKYVDEEGDQITVSTEEDFQTMIQITKGQVKISIHPVEQGNEDVSLTLPISMNSVLPEKPENNEVQDVKKATTEVEVQPQVEIIKKEEESPKKSGGKISLNELLSGNEVKEAEPAEIIAPVKQDPIEAKQITIPELFGESNSNVNPPPPTVEIHEEKPFIMKPSPQDIFKIRNEIRLHTTLAPSRSKRQPSIEERLDEMSSEYKILEIQIEEIDHELRELANNPRSGNATKKLRQDKTKLKEKKRELKPQLRALEREVERKKIIEQVVEMFNMQQEIKSEVSKEEKEHVVRLHDMFPNIPILKIQSIVKENRGANDQEICELLSTLSVSYTHLTLPTIYSV